MFVYLGGAALVCGALVDRVPGGWAEIVATGQAAGKFAVLSLSTDPTVAYTLWAGLVGGVALTLATHGTDQFLVQRLLAARSAREAQVGLVLSGVLVFAQFALFLAIGAMLFAYYQHHPAPALGRADEILPAFIVQTLTGGTAGFIVAAIVAAALSPSLNAMAATTVNDFYRRYVRPDADDRTLLAVARRATVAWGLVQLGVAIGSQWFQRSILDTGLAVLSLTSGPVLGAFLTGVVTRRVGEPAMLAGMAAGLATALAIWWTGAMAFTWFAAAGALTTMAAAWLVALVVPAPAWRQATRT
jgi:Na+/proline symporter